MIELLGYMREFGFPALAFGLMFWLVKDTIGKNTMALNKLDRSIMQLCIQQLKKMEDDKK
jgi:hypothetical protein